MYGMKMRAGPYYVFRSQPPSCAEAVKPEVAPSLFFCFIIIIYICIVFITNLVTHLNLHHLHSHLYLNLNHLHHLHFNSHRLHRDLYLNIQIFIIIIVIVIVIVVVVIIIVVVVIIIGRWLKKELVLFMFYSRSLSVQLSQRGKLLPRPLHAAIARTGGEPSGIAFTSIWG